MNANSKTRYSRQIKLPYVGEQGQNNLLKAHALIVGLGGLGSPVSMYLAAAGVGTLTLCDYDVVDLSNLQRQIVHSQDTIGELKVHSAQQQLARLNSDTLIYTVSHAMDEDELIVLAEQADIIIDCTDNFPSRFGLNRVSIASQKPLVSGAAIRAEGQITAFNPTDPASPCYHCLYPQTDAESAGCAAEGVLAPVVGIIGTLQAQEALNILLGKPALVGKVMLFDARKMAWHSIKLTKQADCLTCA